MEDRHINVVVIDDNADVLLLAKIFLQGNLPSITRVHVTTDADWEKIVDNWNEVAIVFVDLLMPIPGISILRKIKEKYPKVRRIAWTAGTGSQFEEIKRDGLATILDKPNYKDLKKHVENVLEEM